MATLNENIPSFKAMVKKSFFTKNEADTEFYNVYVLSLIHISEPTRPY